MGLHTHDVEFEYVKNVIEYHRASASQKINEESLLINWRIGQFISSKLNSNEWGAKIVSQLSDYLRTRNPDLKGYGRRNLYNMVSFYEEYSSLEFINLLEKYGYNEIVQIPSAQLPLLQDSPEDMDTAFVQMESAQMPKVLTLTTFSNHLTILSQCSSMEEKLFYVIYANRERLNVKELKRCIQTGTYATLLGERNHLSNGLKNKFEGKPLFFKDKAFVDFLNLPPNHDEKQLHNGILEHMKQFVLELGKDFLFVDSEFPIKVGSSTFKIDLVFYHRALRCLVAMELKSEKFKPGDLGQLEFYLEALDRNVKREDENPSIGILLCQTADKQVVEYALNRCMSPAMITQYKRLLIPQKVLQKSLDEYLAMRK